MQLYYVSLKRLKTLQARCGSRASQGSARTQGGNGGAGAADQRLPAANPGLLCEHERSVLLALMLLRHTVRRFNTVVLCSPYAKFRSPPDVVTGWLARRHLVTS